MKDIRTLDYAKPDRTRSYGAIAALAISVVGAPASLLMTYVTKSFLCMFLVAAVAIVTVYLAQRAVIPNGRAHRLLTIAKVIMWIWAPTFLIWSGIFLMNHV
jgi:hypothetical protein